MIQSVQHWPHRHQELCLTGGVDRWTVSSRRLSAGSGHTRLARELDGSDRNRKVEPVLCPQCHGKTQLGIKSEPEC